MGLGRALALRGLSLSIVLISVLLLLVITLGATGLSDRMLSAIVSDEVRAMRQSLAQTIRDPDELERVVMERREELMRLYGLDKPWYHRLPDMMLRVLTLDLGSARTLRSFSGSARVIDIILDRLPNTLILVTTAMLISSLLGIYIGAKLASRSGSRSDRIVSYASALSYAMPSWWLGILMIFLLSYRLGIFPAYGMYSTPPPKDPLWRLIDLLWHSALPVLTLVLVTIGGWIFSARAMLLDISREDYVMVARAKGLDDGLVMKRYILRVAAPPILTNLILGLAGSIAGAILTETVFNWPGMGRLYYDSILALDEPVIIGLTFIFTLIYVVVRFVLEVLYVLVDPRVRY